MESTDKYQASSTYGQLLEIKTNTTIIYPFQKKNVHLSMYQAKGRIMLYPIGIQD